MKNLQIVRRTSYTPQGKEIVDTDFCDEQGHPMIMIRQGKTDMSHKKIVQTVHCDDGFSTFSGPQLFYNANEKQVLFFDDQNWSIVCFYENGTIKRMHMDKLKLNELTHVIPIAAHHSGCLVYSEGSLFEESNVSIDGWRRYWAFEKKAWQTGDTSNMIPLCRNTAKRIIAIHGADDKLMIVSSNKSNVVRVGDQLALVDNLASKDKEKLTSDVTIEDTEKDAGDVTTTDKSETEQFTDLGDQKDSPVDQSPVDTLTESSGPTLAPTSHTKFVTHDKVHLALESGALKQKLDAFLKCMEFDAEKQIIGASSPCQHVNVCVSIRTNFKINKFDVRLANLSAFLAHWQNMREMWNFVEIEVKSGSVLGKDNVTKTYQFKHVCNDQ